MNPLITAAEAALIQLKHLHIKSLGPCPIPECCPTAAAIASLEAEIAKAKLIEEHPMITIDAEFQAVAPFKFEDYIPKPVNPPPTTIDVGDLNAILRAKP